MADTMEELISQIKDRLDIVEVVSEQVILKKNGGHYWGLCPFHKEKTPSFSVNPSLGIYKCFGCGEGGDALSFIMKTKNIVFMDLIKELAEKYGLEMPASFKRSGSSKDLKEHMTSACKKAAEFYHKRLLKDVSTETGKVLKYLNGRGINEDIIKKFTLGIAPKSYTTLYDALKGEFSDEVLEKAGLILKDRDNKYIDRFRNRVIIPIQNEFGDYVAFGARAVEEGQSPKYLNSSDSLIYNKSKLLYGLYTAKDAIKAEDSVVLMEGYFDVISAQAHGIENCVAACGTALTSDHVKLLSRYTKSRRIYLSFDTDSAGQKATERGAEIIREAFEGLGDIKQFDEAYTTSSEDKYSCEIRVISPPEGKDPDEFIRSAGAESYKAYMQHAPLLIDFQMNNILKSKHEIKNALDKTNLVKKIIPVLQEIKNGIVRAEYVKMAAHALDIDENALMREVQKSIISTSRPEENIVKIVTKNSSILEKAQKNLLSIFFVADNRFNLQQIDKMIGEMQLDDETLIIVKSTIDKFLCSVNNVKELIEHLYTEFLQKPEAQKVLTDLITTSQMYSHLSEQDMQTAIEETKRKINQIQHEKEREQLRNLYKSANDDEIEALKLQMQLRDKINNRNKSEKMND